MKRYTLYRKDYPNSGLIYQHDQFDVLSFDTQVESKLVTGPRGGFYVTLQRASDDELQARKQLKGSVFCLLMSEHLVDGSAVGRVFLVLGVSSRRNDKTEAETTGEVIFSRLGILSVSRRYAESKSWFEDMDKSIVRIE